ncbi:MAG: sugar ABC transporter permease [Thermomicrobiales bacterium]
MTTAYRRASGLQRMERFWGVALALPAILGFLIFTLGPVIASFGISLTDWNIYGDASFIGFANYREMLTEDALFRKSLGVTLTYASISVPLTMIVAFLVALLLNQDVKGRSFFRTIYYLPVLVPVIANTILWLWLFNPEFGLLNQILERIGLPTSQWIYDPNTAVLSLALMGAWGFGNAAVIFLAGLQGVPGHLYEAVAVDGGGPFRKLFDVTIPMMTPTILFNLVMGLIGAFQAFSEAYVMTNGGPSNSTLLYVYYLYRTAFSDSRMGYASALAWFLFVVIMIVALIVFRSSRLWVYYESEGQA